MESVWMDVHKMQQSSVLQKHTMWTFYKQEQLLNWHQCTGYVDKNSKRTEIETEQHRSCGLNLQMNQKDS